VTYELKRHTEVIGDLNIEIETIADLDEAIDRLCEGKDDKKAEAIFLEDLCPYFGVVWPSARALAIHLSKMGSWLNGKTVLELGCGLALPSIVAAKLGAKVVATDFHPDVPKFLEHNLKINNVRIDYRDVDWRSENTSIKETFDFVIGSDILYEAGQSKAVARALDSYCHRGSHIILADPGRPYLQACVDELSHSGYHGDLFIAKVADGHEGLASIPQSKEIFLSAFQKRI
jgi:predicted nicotinamide N-methyase